MKSTLRSLITLAALIPSVASSLGPIANLAKAQEPQAVTIRFRAKVGNQAFACGSNYSLGKPVTPQTLSDFRFYVSDLALIDAAGKTIPLTLTQDGKWQYQTVALLDFEDKTGACSNGTTELRDRVIGSVPKGKYTGLKFTLGIPFAANHSDAALAPSPLNLTGLWWNWQLGYKFARIDLQSPAMPPTMGKPHQGHGEAGGFPVHLGSTGCLSETSSDRPKSCTHPNRATVVLTGFDFNKNLVVADLAQLVATTDLTQNQAASAPGCMSEPNDQDCLGIMAKLGLPFMTQSAPPQTFFRVE